MRKQPGLIVLLVLGIMLMMPAVMSASTNVIFDATKTPLPDSTAAWPFAIAQTSELGDHIAFAGSARSLNTVVVTLTTRACQILSLDTNFDLDYQPCDDDPQDNSLGYTHPVTLNLYAVDNSGPVPAAGALLHSTTETFLIPWRPGTSQGCLNGGWGPNCHYNLAFNIEFDVPGVVVPDEIVYGIAINTEQHGYTPIGTPGPYDWLEVGLSLGVPAVGKDVARNTMFVNCPLASGCTGAFDPLVIAVGYTPAIRFVADPLPSPSSRADCTNGGWKNLGFKNQGQCNKFVNAGRDSR